MLEARLSMRKIISFCIALSLIILSGLVSVSAAEGMWLVVEQKNALPGETITLSVEVKGNPGFTYVKLGLEYDESVLSLRSVQNGELIESLTEGRYYVWSAAENQTCDGVLVTFTFFVSENAVAGKNRVSVRCYECSNDQELDVPVSVQEGEITVEVAHSAKIGDVDGNGKIGPFDYMLTKRYVLKKTTLDAAQLKAADIDGNGKVNAKDYALLKMHVLGKYTIGQ